MIRIHGMVLSLTASSALLLTTLLLFPVLSYAGLFGTIDSVDILQKIAEGSSKKDKRSIASDTSKDDQSLSKSSDDTKVPEETEKK